MVDGGRHMGLIQGNLVSPTMAPALMFGQQERSPPAPKKKGKILKKRAIHCNFQLGHRFHRAM
jgi:hypothetical protein